MHIANTDVTFCDGLRIKTIKLDVNQTRCKGNAQEPPHPALDTNRERNTYSLDGIK